MDVKEQRIPILDEEGREMFDDETTELGYGGGA